MTYALGLKVGRISSTDPETVQYHMDCIDSAISEIAETTRQAAYVVADTQREMRRIQALIASSNPELKVTQVERLYKSDNAHADLERLHHHADALQTYCETVKEVLTNKYFELRRKGRG